MECNDLVVEESLRRSLSPPFLPLVHHRVSSSPTKHLVFVGSLQVNPIMKNNGIALNGLLEQNAFPAADSAMRNLSHPVALYENSPGIVHRFDNAYATYPPYALAEDIGGPFLEPIYTSQVTRLENVDEVIYKCPCCRGSNSKMLCVVCTLQQIRVNKVRERYRALFLQKADLCRQIEQQLKPNTNFQIDLHAKQRSVKILKEKIKTKGEQLDRIRQRIRNIDINNTTTIKNISSLEKKLCAHAERLAHLDSDIEKRHNTLTSTLKELTKTIVIKVTELLEIFPIKRFEKLKSRNFSDQKPPDAWRVGNQHIMRRPIYYTIKDLNLNDYCEYEKLLAELCTSSTTMQNGCSASTSSSHVLSQKLSLLSRQNLGALLSLSKLCEQLSILLDCRLPYLRINHCFMEMNCEASRSACTQNLFNTNIFKLNFCIVYLCIASGVQPTVLDLERPMNNICFLINSVTGSSLQPPQQQHQKDLVVDHFLQLNPVLDGFNAKLHLQIVEEFHKIIWEERHHDFTFDNIGEDWVNITLASK